MKKLILLIIIFLSLSSLAFVSGFCEGWHNGYIAGYCYGSYSCLPPLVPLCPLPSIGEDSYQGGYNRGFLAGLSAKI